VKRIKPSSSTILLANTKALANTVANLQSRDQLRKLIAAVCDVRAHRQMTSPEPPDMQDSWDRLQIAVLEAERILQSPLKPKKLVDKRRK
jgi:hypothetical protein